VERLRRERMHGRMAARRQIPQRRKLLHGQVLDTNVLHRCKRLNAIPLSQKYDKIGIYASHYLYTFWFFSLFIYNFI
jgi:hypothetical protein